MFKQPVTRQNLSLDVLRSRALPLLFLLPLLLLIAASACTHLESSYRPLPGSRGCVSSDRYRISVRTQVFTGKATASGVIYDQNDLTAAHQIFPLGTRVMATNLETGSSAEVTINDRGPFAAKNG